MASEVLELGTFKETRKGSSEVLKFKVTTVPVEIVDELVDHMIKYFFAREPLSEHTNLINDPVAVTAVRKIWKELILEGNAIVAIAESPGPLKDRIVGANLTYISKKDKDHKIPEDEDWGGFKVVYESVIEITDRAKAFEKYGVDKILSAFGLSVHPDYHGYRIGERLLQCREPLCHHLGIKISGTLFTAVASQHLSHKVGFKVLYEVDYSELRYHGEAIFAKIPGKLEYSVIVYS